MEYEISTGHNALERMLIDGSTEPMDLPLSLLEDITNCFSDDQQIGSGGFALVYKVWSIRYTTLISFHLITIGLKTKLAYAHVTSVTPPQAQKGLQ